MPTMILELDTYATRARRAAAKRKKAKSEERWRRSAGSKGWMLDAVPTPEVKPKGNVKPA